MKQDITMRSFYLALGGAAALGLAWIFSRTRRLAPVRKALRSLLVGPSASPVKKAVTELLLVRHGQSMHNVSDVAQYGDTGADATLFDAPLSPLGENQVAALAGHPELAAAELVVTSPLTRAVQTLLGAFPKAPAACPPIEMWPLAAEHLTDSCDIGSGASVLARRTNLGDRTAALAAPAQVCHELCSMHLADFLR